MKKIATLCLTAALCLAPAYAASGFSDVPEGRWYSDEIAAMSAAGYIDGYEDGTFRPEGEVSVPEFVTITARCLGLPTGAQDGRWAGVQLEYALENGWLDAREQAEGAVSRQLAAKILVCALGLAPDGEAPFTDAGDILAPYAGYVAAAWGAELMEGFEDGSFRPEKALSRAEAAVLISRAVRSCGPERLTAAPDGTPFGGSVELAGYDNPNFRLMLSAGRATVVIDKAELWTDYADPGSPDPAEAAEGRRRQEVLEAMGREREIPAPAVVSEVYELPCTSWFPGSDANALIRTEDGAWYFVELSGRNNGCVPELTELTALRGLEISSLRWCTTTREEDGVLVCGRDYLVASLPGGGEFVAYGY